MAISPINSVSFRGVRNRNENNFEKAKEDSQNLGVRHSQTARMSAMSVPVVVLMAMNPSMLNAKEPVSFQPMVNGAPTEMYVDAPKHSLEISELKETQEVPPYGDWACLKETGNNVLFHKAFYRGKEKYHMLFLGFPRNKEVYEILLVPEWMEPSKDPQTVPGKVIDLVHHKLDNGESFYSAYVSDGCDDETGKFSASVIHEITVPDHIAKEMLKLKNGETEFENHSVLKFGGYREVNTDKMRPVKFVEEN